MGSLKISIIKKFHICFNNLCLLVTVTTRTTADSASVCVLRMLCVTILFNRGLYGPGSTCKSSFFPSPNLGWLHPQLCCVVVVMIQRGNNGGRRCRRDGDMCERDRVRKKTVVGSWIISAEWAPGKLFNELDTDWMRNIYARGSINNEHWTENRSARCHARADDIRRKTYCHPSSEWLIASPHLPLKYVGRVLVIIGVEIVDWDMFSCHWLSNDSYDKEWFVAAFRHAKTKMKWDNLSSYLSTLGGHDELVWDMLVIILFNFGLGTSTS